MASMDGSGQDGIGTNGAKHADANGNSDILDAVVVGGGFGGCYLLHTLRKQGLRVKLIEAMDGFGGTWRGNRYPGARVDCEMPYYLLSAPELMNTWTWTEKFPDHNELRSYFEHVDKVWDLSKDSLLNTRVTSATYDEGKKLWHVKTSTGLALSCRWFLPSAGTSHKQHVPSWPGLADFRGEVYHPASWPKRDSLASFRGKRVAVIGAGASAVQIVQEAAKHASQLTQFVRNPATALPMRQRHVSAEEVEKMRPKIPSMIERVRRSRAGLPYDTDAKSTLAATPEEREAIWTKRWDEGGFAWTACCFADKNYDKTANRLSYDFWARQVRARLPDPVKRDILAPLEPPYYIGTKRLPLEQDYYEMVSKPHVEITNTPVASFDETGIHTNDGRHREFDLVVVATGYDAVTGTLKELGVRGRDSLSMGDKWNDGVRTYLGMSVHGFPNMFFVYGPQAPSSFSAGPPFIEQQVEWICHVIAKAKAAGWSTIEATEEAEEEWRKLTLAISNKTLLVQTDSWYMGTNVPGKKKEMMLFLGGMPLYFDKCNEALDGMKGFRCS